jgi:hypothetical protein
MATVMGTDGDVGWTVHIDLHETTDTDNTEFIPAKAKRDGQMPTTRPDAIPDGFYLVQDTTAPQPAWFAAMIAKVRTVTHIAPPDAQGKLIGEDVTMDGVIGIPSNRALGLCAGVTSAPYRVSFVIIYIFFRNGIEIAPMQRTCCCDDVGFSRVEDSFLRYHDSCVPNYFF